MAKTRLHVHNSCRPKLETFHDEGMAIFIGQFGHTPRNNPRKRSSTSVLLEVIIEPERIKGQKTTTK